MRPTYRLRFEPLNADHALELFEPLHDPCVFENINDDPPLSAEALAERFTRMAAGPPDGHSDERWVNYVVKTRVGGIAIGRVEATITSRIAEVAYLFGRAHWGQGYATEAMTVFEAHLQDDWSVNEYWATTSPRNTRSIRLLRRLGYEEVAQPRPELKSYDPGDLVFVRRHAAQSTIACLVRS